MGTAPSITEYLNEDSAVYYDKVQELLTMMDVPFEKDPNLVRGLDYYQHTVFEIMSEAEGFGAITTLAVVAVITDLYKKSVDQKCQVSVLQ